MNKKLAIIFLIIFSLQTLFADSMDIQISKAKFLIESDNNYDEAIKILNSILNLAKDKTSKSKIYFYLFKCYLFKNYQEKMTQYLDILKIYNNDWSKKAIKLYQSFSSYNNKSSYSFSKYISSINSNLLNEIIQEGGKLKYLEVFFKNNINAGIYLSLLKNDISIDTFFLTLTELHIKPENVVKLLLKKITPEEYKYLLNQTKDFTKDKFWLYAEKPKAIHQLVALYKLNFDEKKYIFLKEKKIDIQFFIDSITHGFTEEDFFKFQNKRISSKDLEFYNFFIKQGNKKRNFPIAKIFGKSGYDNFLRYLKNRKIYTINLVFTISLSFSSLSLFATGFVMAYQEAVWNQTKENLWHQYYQTFDADEREHIRYDLVPEAQNNIDIYYQNKIIFLTIGGIITASIIVPAVFFSFYFVKNYRMLNFFSMVDIGINEKYLSLQIRLPL